MSVHKPLGEELYKPVTEKYERRKVYGRLKENIWATDLAVMEKLC